ncbi:MAG: SDR family oxidoreductase, partial [Actinomycetota bacterium]|nr:SDR family oxidoreductase [Actinomycetota bacterium]
ASGIGACTVERFMQEGAKVVLGDIQSDLGMKVADQLGESADFFKCDVTDDDDVSGLIDYAIDTHGQIDIMMNNAGIVGARGPITQIPREEFEATIQIHLIGTFLGMKYAAQAMKGHGTGSIINLASTAGVNGGWGPHAYAAAKHAIVGLTKNVAAELCRYGIRVNCIAPGSTATPLVAKAHLDDHEALSEVKDRLAELSPILGRPGQAIDVANAALYLASEESGNTNGHCLVVDGGATTGSKPGDPPYSTPEPFLREGGKSGM